MNGVPSVQNPFAVIPIQEDFDYPQYIPFKEKDDVEFRVTFDTTDGFCRTKIILLFARIHEVDYYLSTCPIEDSFLTSAKKVQIENVSVKINQKLFPQSITHKTSLFFRYLLDREKLKEELVQLSKGKLIGLKRASNVSYSKEKRREVAMDLYHAIQKESETLLDEALRIGAYVDQSYFICSHDIFSSPPDKVGHWCEKTKVYSGNTYNTFQKDINSREVTPLSLAKGMKNIGLVQKLFRFGATEEVDQEYKKTEYAQEWDILVEQD